MALQDSFVPGDHNATCYECGHKFKASQLKKHWQGYWVCPQHWEPRHPQDFVRSPTDTATVPWSQPESDNQLRFCSPLDKNAVAGIGVAGCMIAGVSNYFHSRG